MTTKPLKGYRLKDGKLVKTEPRSVSDKIRQRKSKKVRVSRRAPG